MEFNDPIHQRRRRIFSLIKFDLTASNVLIPVRPLNQILALVTTDSISRRLAGSSIFDQCVKISVFPVQLNIRRPTRNASFGSVFFG